MNCPPGGPYLSPYYPYPLPYPPPPFNQPPPGNLSIPQVTDCRLFMNVKPSTVNLINDFIPINLGIYFNSITSLETVSGTFTPANDTLVIASGITTNPNFIILVTNNQVNLTIQAGATNLVLQNPVMKLYFSAMLQNTTYGITTITLDGTTTAPVPMTQAIPVSYTLIYGNGIVS